MASDGDFTIPSRVPKLRIPLQELYLERMLISSLSTIISLIHEIASIDCLSGSVFLFVFWSMYNERRLYGFTDQVQWAFMEKY